LADAYALRGLAHHSRSYGPVRLWGSAAFIAGSLGGGLVLDVIAPRHLIWLIVAALGLTAVAACTLAPLADRPAGKFTLSSSARRARRMCAGLCRRRPRASDGSGHGNRGGALRPLGQRSLRRNGDRGGDGRSSGASRNAACAPERVNQPKK